MMRAPDAAASNATAASSPGQARRARSSDNAALAQSVRSVRPPGPRPTWSKRTCCGGGAASTRSGSDSRSRSGEGEGGDEGDGGGVGARAWWRRAAARAARAPAAAASSPRGPRSAHRPLLWSDASTRSAAAGEAQTMKATPAPRCGRGGCASPPEAARRPSLGGEDSAAEERREEKSAETAAEKGDDVCAAAAAGGEAGGSDGGGDSVGDAGAAARLARGFFRPAKRPAKRPRRSEGAWTATTSPGKRSSNSALNTPAPSAPPSRRRGTPRSSSVHRRAVSAETEKGGGRAAEASDAEVEAVPTSVRRRTSAASSAAAPATAAAQLARHTAEAAASVAWEASLEPTFCTVVRPKPVAAPPPATHSGKRPHSAGRQEVAHTHRQVERNARRSEASAPERDATSDGVARSAADSSRTRPRWGARQSRRDVNQRERHCCPERGAAHQRRGCAQRRQAAAGEGAPACSRQLAAKEEQKQQRPTADGEQHRVGHAAVDEARRPGRRRGRERRRRKEFHDQCSRVVGHGLRRTPHLFRGRRRSAASTRTGAEKRRVPLFSKIFFRSLPLVN